MVIVKIIGGLGNQMFQYAYAKSLQQKGYKVKIDIKAFEVYKLHGGYQLDKYAIDLEPSNNNENGEFYSNSLVSRILRKIGIDTTKTTNEKNLLFDKELLKMSNHSYMIGYFQSEKYFNKIRSVLVNQFTIKGQISDYTKNVEQQIYESVNNCSLHIRRGDFVNDTNIAIHGSCGIEYYKDAMKFLEKKVENVKYFIFSDDIKWCKESLEIENVVFIESEEKRLPHEDIHLMSLCSHNIIANSTFSWWGAWLNQNEEKIVIAPKRWFADDELEKQSKDIVCENWIRV